MTTIISNIETEHSEFFGKVIDQLKDKELEAIVVVLHLKDGTSRIVYTKTSISDLYIAKASIEAEILNRTIEKNQEGENE